MRGGTTRGRHTAAWLVRAAAALVAALALSACPDARVAPPSDALTDADAVLAVMAERLGRLSSVTIESRVSYYSDAGARKGKMVILAQRPGALYFEALSPTDDMLGVLASNGTTFTSFERGGEVCQTGPACPRNVGRMLPLAMEGEDVVTVLFGGAPLIRAASRAVDWDPGVGAYKVTLTGDDGAVQRVWVEHGTGLVRKTDLVRGGERVFDLTFDDPQTVGGVRMPGALHATMARGDVDVRIVYRDVTVNEAIDAEAFNLACPAGLRVEEMSCDGGR